MKRLLWIGSPFFSDALSSCGWDAVARHNFEHAAVFGWHDLVRIAGFVAPLDFLGGDQLSEFLLVPYFGACIHVPPPPANQIVYVILEKPMGIQMMDTVMVYGKLEIEKSESDIGDAGYRIRAVAVEPYAAEETETN